MSINAIFSRLRMRYGLPESNNHLYIMNTYTFEDVNLGHIQFSDKKRHWWLLSPLWALMPVLTIVAYLVLDNPWVLIVPLVTGYVVLPALDYLIKPDRTNPPEQIVPQLDADPYYRWLTYLIIPVHIITLLVSAWFVATYPLSLGFFVAFSVSCGIYGGLSINTAHEVGHKNTKLARRLSRVALAVSGYGHFCVEHNLGHHRDVSTPEDPASSRMGESIYRFALREIPGAMKRGWAAEQNRLERRGFKVWSFRNHILQSYTLTLLLQGGAVLLFGWLALPFFVIHNVFAWLQLTSANYIEHYGLLREKKENGKYESCKPHHSWNANHLPSNLMLFQLERHSDHHANPSRPYQSLRSFENLPELPSGYFGMYMVAYFPRWWFSVMDKRLLAIAHINGDFSKINVDPGQADRLIAQYAT